MPHLAAAITRRRLMAGVAATLLALPAATRAPAQGATRSGDFRLLRAGPLAGSAAASVTASGYDGASPGPVLRVKRGEEVRVRLANELASDTSLHWHGVRVPNAMDGVPHLTQAPVPPGGSFDYRFVAPDAGTYWYHALVAEPAGLAGAFIVDEVEPVEADRDVVLMLADPPRARDSNGSPPRTDRASAGDQAPAINGAPSFDVPVKANERIRLRLVNACHARLISLRLDRHRATVMAIDGQPAEPFAAQDGRVGFGPGNRVDLFVDMGLAPGTTASAFIVGERGEVPLVRFIYDAGAPRRAAPLPDPRPLPANALPARIDLRNALRVELPIDKAARQWTEAGAAASGRYGPALFSAKRRRPVVIAFVNRTDDAAALHLHGHHARLLDNLDDGWKPFWLDTVMAAARQPTRIAFVADNPGKWLIECRIVGKEDAGMATWFEVT
jgi:FtsP/CotA-like multicopper oxidase with cupredoxin domain